MTVPEDTVNLVCPTSQDKSQWLHVLQEAIKQCVGPPAEMNLVTLRAPPLVRSAEFVFLKHPQYKDAKYQGVYANLFCYKNY